MSNSTPTNSTPSNYSTLIQGSPARFRINHFLSKAGICSRRGADRLVRQGRVKVNAQVAYLGQKVSLQDRITVDGQALLLKPVNHYFFRLYHKPRGIVTTQNPIVEDNFLSALKAYPSEHKWDEWPEHFFAVGRLDKASEGALLLTNHGDLCNFLLQQDSVSKQYLVQVTPKITHEFLRQMASGVKILGETTQPCVVFRLADNLLQIELKQGLNRQIRRMCQALGYRVERLTRVTFAGVTLDGLMAGQSRALSENEVLQLLGRFSVSHEISKGY